MNTYIILGHENPDVDSIISGYLLEKLLKNKGIHADFIIPDKSINSEISEFCKSYGIDTSKFQKEIDLSDKNNKYILVDHHERNVSGEIVGVIDHHPINAKEIGAYYDNRHSSSTTCIICQERENEFSKDDLELACLAAFVDTASFNSTKGREEDRKWIEEICQKYNIDYNKLYKAGLFLNELDDLKKCSLNGLKKYNFAGKKVQSSYVQIENTLEEQEKIKKILKILTDYIITEDVDIFVFIVHDMTLFKSKVYQLEHDGIKEKQFDKYTSRGTKIIPDIENELLKNTKNKIY